MTLVHGGKTKMNNNRDFRDQLNDMSYNEPINSSKSEDSLSPTDEGTKRSNSRKGKVFNASYVRLRKEPSPEAKTIVVLEAGEEVEIIEKIEKTKELPYEYYKVIAKSHTNPKNPIVGFIRCDFCKEV